MAANALKTQEIRLDELNTDRIERELQLRALELMNEEIDISDPTAVYNWTVEREGNYAVLRGTLRYTRSFEEAGQILKADLNDIIQEEMKAEVQFLREANKVRQTTLEILESEIETAEFSLSCKREDYAQEATQANRRAVREIEVRLEMVHDIRNTLLGQ